ncbi:MAG TPA: PAS domain S-box protein, partial [Dehalococcoidia bacterium]|nr:PAS domain S-box protein [Dehalococcoidia bacterium]
MDEQSEREPWLTPPPDGASAPVVSDARFESIVARMFDVVCEIDAQSHFAYVSPNVSRMLGYRAEDLLGTPALDLVHPDDRPDVASKYARALAEDDAGTKAFRARHADGHYVWVEVSMNPRIRGDERRAVIVIRDITERVQVANALLESEQRLQAFVSGAPVVMFAADLDGVLTLCEGRALEAMGAAPGEWVGRRIIDVAGGDPHVAEDVRRALRGETFTDVRSVGERTYEVHHAPLRDARGALTGFTGIMVDVTERVREQHAAAERARAAAISSEIGTILVESQSTEDMLRRSAEAVQRGTGATAVRIARYSEDGGICQEVTAGLSYDRTSPEVAEAEAWLDRAARGCRRVVIDLRNAPEARAVVEKAGYRGQVSYAIFPLVLNDHAVGALSLLTTDELPQPAIDALDSIARTLTLGIEQKRVEMDLRKSEERYRAIYQNHSVVRYLIDEEGTIVDINEPGCAFYGYRREELVGRNVALINTLPRAELQAAIRSALHAGRTTFQFKHRLRSGEIRDVEVHTAPVEIEGRALLFSIAQDITERKYAEALLESQRRLLEMVAAGAALPDVLERIAVTVEEHAPGSLCSVLLVDETRLQLRHAAAPSLPAAYNALVDGLVIGPDVGACGAAAARGQEVVIADIQAHPDERFREACRQYHLRSCWSTPIFSPGGAVTGTFAIYRRDVYEPTERERDLVRIATHIAGLAIERERAEAALRHRNDELERMYAQLVRAHADLEVSQGR